MGHEPRRKTAHAHHFDPSTQFCLAVVNETAASTPCSVVGINHVDRVEAAYRQIHPRLWRALYAYAGDREIATDAEAEAFTQVIRRGDAVLDVEAWTWRAAFRIAGGMLGARRHVHTDVPPSASDNLTVDTSIVEFVSQLADLSDQQRAIVVLRYVGQFTPGEIADLLHTTSGSVRVQLHRAHKSLRHSLETTHG